MLSHCPRPPFTGRSLLSVVMAAASGLSHNWPWLEVAQDVLANGRRE